MAVTSAGRALTLQHRRAQQTVRAAAAADTLTVWAAFDPSDIDGSWSVIEPAMLAVTSDYRRQSADVAAGYFQAYRTAEGVPGSFSPSLAVPPSREVLRYSLGYYGMVVPNELLRAGRLDVASQAAVHMVGGVSRHVLDGGRDTVLGNVRDDRRARAWRRVTDGGPCSFCAMIAARGAVFREETARFEAHDHCACMAEPAYTSDDQRTDAERAWRQLWDESTQGYSGRDALNAFRRAYEAA